MNIVKNKNKYKNILVILLTLVIIVIVVFVLVSLFKFLNKKKDLFQNSISNDTSKKLKVCVLMFYDDAIKEYSELNYKLNKLYCDKHNIDLILSQEKTYKDKHPSWEKLPLILKHIKNYDYIMWVDADAFFYNDAGNISDIINKHLDKNFIFSYDTNQLTENDKIVKFINCGVFIVKNSQYSIDFLNKWAYDEELFKNNSHPEWWEQGVLIDIQKQNILNIKENQFIYDYSILQHFNEKDPGKDSVKPYILHLAGSKTEERVNTSKKYYAKITTENEINKLTKKECELVIARYSEDLAWSKPYKHLRTVYNKGEDNLGDEYQPIIKLENVGTEINTILEHIIRNYDNLANNTIFMQGNISDRHCNDSILFETFFHSRDNDLIGCKKKMGDLYNTNFNFRINNYNNKKLEPSPHNLGEFFEKVLGIRYSNESDVIYQSNFAVGKKRILYYSKQYYLNLLNNTTISKHRFPEEGHYMERAWAVLFS